jgi:hypothetical protein
MAMLNQESRRDGQVRWVAAALTLVSSCCFASGCSRVPSGIAPVSGRVTIAGQPLSGATVTFQPLGSVAEESAGIGGSFGTTDGDGRFELRLIDPDVPGAAIGKHAVTITTARLSGGDAARPKGERAPVAWRDGSQTYLVPAAGTTRADFDLP